MITISNFTERMGNQLFQIAAAATLAQENGELFLCPKGWVYQKYFKTKFAVYNNEPVENLCIENGFHYSKIPFKKNLAIDGYFQSHKYFDNEKIKDLFAFEDNTLVPPSFLNGYASIHVRRTDYLKYPDHHPLCTLEYYRKAIEFSGYKHFTVFSDDPEWCEKHIAEEFKDCDFNFSLSNSDITDFELMSQCSCNIIANSTFSWWAAMLNKNPDKLIITPSQDNWHGPAYAHWDHSDLLPEDWKQIKF